MGKKKKEEGWSRKSLDYSAVLRVSARPVGCPQAKVAFERVVSWAKWAMLSTGC